MSELFIVMSIFTSIIIFVFIMCPLASFLISISPLDKYLYWSLKLYDYIDYIMFGLPVWAIIGFIAGWVVAILQVFI